MHNYATPWNGHRSEDSLSALATAEVIAWIMKLDETEDRTRLSIRDAGQTKEANILLARYTCTCLWSIKDVRVLG